MSLAARTSVIYPYPIAERYVLTRDGARIMEGTEQEIWTYLHANHSTSVSRLLKHEGYRLEAMS